MHLEHKDVEIWIDTQLSPAVALWLNSTFKGIIAKSVRSLQLRDASDMDIFMKAKGKDVVIMSKDADFVDLIRKFGPPPQLIWITVGNTSNQNIREVLSKHWENIMLLLRKGESIVAIEA